MYRVNKVKYRWNFDYKLFFVLLLSSLLPSVYKTIRIFIIGTIEDENAYSISSQLMWVNLLYEVVQEYLLLPLFYVLSLNKSDKFIYFWKNELGNKVKTGLIVIVCIYVVFALVIILSAYKLCELMNVNNNIIDQTVVYVRWETFAFLFVVVYQFLLRFLIVLDKKIAIVFLSLLEILLYLICDLFIVSGFSFSFGLKTFGIPISNIITNFLLIIGVIVFLYFESIKLFTIKKTDWSWIVLWVKKGSWIGLESFIRNIVFMLMVVRIANMVSNSGTYWIANNFIWNWLLLPMTALNELIKKEISETNNKRNYIDKTITYFIVVSIFCLIWLVSIPTWNLFVEKVMNYKDYNSVSYIALIQTGFYLLFMYNNIMDSTFYGSGKTFYILLQSIIVNIVYYSIAFVLFNYGVVEYSLLNLCLMFGIGMTIDIIPTSIQYYFFNKKINKNLNLKIG